jgi:hypothetical protein
MDFELEKKPARRDTKTTPLLAPKPVRRSSNDFDDSVFGVKGISGADASLNSSHIFDTMSNYDDLKFLIKALRKEKVGSTISSFGTTKTWTIVAPLAWESKRRTAFLQWASRGLGFSLRAGGGAVAFLQISMTKGGAILESLEAALIAHKVGAQNASSDESKSQFRTNDIKSFVQSDLSRYVHLNDEEACNLVATHVVSFRFVIRPSTCFGAWSISGAKKMSSVDQDIDMGLVTVMESLNVVANSKEAEVPYRESSAMVSETPLVRIVTMDTTSASPHPKEMACLPAILDDVEYIESPHESHRLSGEYHVGGHDLTLHLHGLSPAPDCGRPRLSLPRNHRTSRLRHASPFLQPLSARHGAPRLSNISCVEDEGLET